MESTTSSPWDSNVFLCQDLVNAASKGAVELMLRAMAFGGSSTELVDGRNALHAAAEANQDVAVEFLLQNGALPNAVDDSGRTALAIAIENECPQVVSLLSPLSP